MILDNYAYIRQFAPEKEDGDTFIYTEMLDRGQKKGNNGQRLLKTFYHRSREEFDEQIGTIRRLCDMAKVRACTRLAPRSYEKVGRTFTRLVVDTAMSNNWAGMKSLYNRACGTTTPNDKLWLWDVDVLDDRTETFQKNLEALGCVISVIPSKKAKHIIARPYNLQTIMDMRNAVCGLTDAEVSLHKDNPTNLYIPDGAD